MSAINNPKTYQLHDAYATIKQRAIKILDKYLKYPGLITFDDHNNSVTFTTEKLIPVTFTDRPRVLLLFSNPHPYSVYKGMFLSPNIHGQQNLFWPVMEDAGWITFTGKINDPEHLADVCLHAKYQGPFDLIFYCYYAFPTPLPEEIQKIFGAKFFQEKIEPEAIKEFQDIVNTTSVKAVVTFNKGIFNLVSTRQVDFYIDCLTKGKLIGSQIKGIDRNVPFFLSFPTGWRYHKKYKQFRKANLDKIREVICSM